MDIQMPGCDGLEVTQRIKRKLPGTVIVILTVRDEEEKLFEAIKNGRRVLSKNIRSRDLLEDLRGAMRGEAVISPVLAGRMLEEFRRLSQLAPQEALDDELAALTGREKEILSQVALGRSDKEIASMLSSACTR